MNNNEEFINKILNHKSSVIKELDYISEAFNTNADYDEESNAIYIIGESDNALNNVLAKEYLEGTLGEDMIAVNIVPSITNRE